VVDQDRGQRWTAYAGAVLAFNLIGWGFLYLILRLQEITPRASDGLMPRDAVKGCFNSTL
jgi:potassium-transporting ATPase potassium-binding subunit